MLHLLVFHLRLGDMAMAAVASVSPSPTAVCLEAQAMLIYIIRRSQCCSWVWRSDRAASAKASRRVTMQDSV